MGEKSPIPDMPRSRYSRIIAGRAVAFDSEGFIENFEDWSEEIFATLCQESGLDRISEEQRKVLDFLRNYYAYNGRGPLNNELRKGVGLSLMEIEALFPGGLRNGARRIAGLPNPKGCL
jgi:dissimilatory sulfite reductase related protein